MGRTVGPPVATFRGSVPPPRFNGGGLALPSQIGTGAGFGIQQGLYGSRGYNGHSEHGEHRGGYAPGFYHGPVWGGWGGLGYPGYFGDGYPLTSGFDDSGTAGNAYGATGAAGAMDPYGPAGPPPDYSGASGAYPQGYSSAYPPASAAPSGYAAPPAPAAAASAPVAAAQNFRPQYQPQTQSAVAAAPEDEEQVTLVFKDKRPSEHIHNYAMTRTTLYVQDKRHREIPLADLDLPATLKANHEAGVSFEVPEGVQ
jgi:hypothetical protein